MDSHAPIRPLLADFVLDELPPAGRRAVEIHLRECPVCAAEARELALAFQAIGLAEEPVAPPPHLRARVLAILGDPARRPPVPDNIARGRFMLRPAWLIAAAVVLLAIGAALAVPLARGLRARQQLQSAENQLRQLETQVALTREQASLTVAILTAPDMRPIDLAGAGASTDSIARAYWSRRHGLLIVADQLPPPPQGRAYQVWLIASDNPSPVSAGLIEGPRSGRGILIVPPPAGIGADTVTIAITDEPAGGLSAPSGARHFIGS